MVQSAPKPIHGDSECHIEREDFHAFLASLDVNDIDLILTDPPYRISKETGFVNVKNGVKRFAVSMDFGEWDKVPIDLDKLSQGMYRVMRQGGTAIVFYDIWKIQALAEAMKRAKFRMLRVIIWQKTNPVPLNQKVSYLANSREMAVMAVKGSKPVFKGTYHNGVYEMPIPRHNGNRTHPTQKPLELFKQLIEQHSNKGDTVIDPFLGSGTTAIACIETGRFFKGCDKSSQYVELAKNRVRDVILQQKQ